MNTVWVLFHESKIHKIFASREPCLTEMREQAILGNFMAYQEVIVEASNSHKGLMLYEKPMGDLTWVWEDSNKRTLMGKDQDGVTRIVVNRSAIAQLGSLEEHDKPAT